jgi:hypothetical protein
MSRAVVPATEQVVRLSLARRRSIVPWIFLLYHARRGELRGRLCVRAAAEPRRRAASAARCTGGHARRLFRQDPDGREQPAIL